MQKVLLTILFLISIFSGSALLSKEGKLLGVYHGSTDNGDFKSNTTFSTSFRHILRKMILRKASCKK